MFIPFNKPYITDLERKHVLKALEGKLCGDGDYTKRVIQLLNEKFGYRNFLLSFSGTQSLELSALIAGINSGKQTQYYLFYRIRYRLVPLYLLLFSTKKIPFKL